MVPNDMEALFKRGPAFDVGVDLVLMLEPAAAVSPAAAEAAVAAAEGSAAPAAAAVPMDVVVDVVGRMQRAALALSAVQVSCGQDVMALDSRFVWMGRFPQVRRGCRVPGLQGCRACRVTGLGDLDPGWRRVGSCSVRRGNGVVAQVHGGGNSRRLGRQRGDVVGFAPGRRVCAGQLRCVLDAKLLAEWRVTTRAIVASFRGAGGGGAAVPA